MFYFSPFEIATLSMQIEEAGLEYYSKLANLMKDEGAKKVLEFLSDQEAKHKKIFEDIAKSTENKYPQAEYVIDVRLQIDALLDLIKRKSFDIDSVTSDSFDYLQAIEVGIQTEIQSISVYQLAKKTFIDAYTPVLDEVILEEEKHLDMLQTLKQQYQKA
jgi:rubrerythrin